MTVRRMERRDAAGWELGMHVIPLPGGRTLVHSPTWLGEGTFDRVAEAGAPAVLLAPNHFHHLSLRRFGERFPEARAVSSATAAPRLRRQGHEGIGLSSEIASLLGDVRIHELPHTKNGETIVSLPVDGGRGWVVCDSFFHVPRPCTGFRGFVLRQLHTVPGLRVGRTYRWLAVADRAQYLDALTGLVRDEKPRAIWFSHGDPLTGSDLSDRLLEAARLGLG